MKKTNQEIDDLLDQLTASMRHEELESTEVNEAAGRVWARLAQTHLTTAAPAAELLTPSEHIHNCADFQSLIPAYLKSQLSEARTLLLEDHTHECIPCRRALKEARLAERGVASSPATVKPFGPRRRVLQQPLVRWAIAASIILVCGLVVAPFVQRFVPWGSGIDPVVQAVNGAVYLVGESQSQEVASGNNFKTGERIRTAKEAGAVVRLSDGSLVEMRERSEFSVTENLQGTTIHLDRGSIIVQAAKQHDKHLFVATDDCLVSVKGTIFSVNSGMKGSRVSVVEGEVHVDHHGAKNVLHPGDQVTTTDNLESVPVKEEIAWSRDADRYLKLLAGIEDLRRNLDTRVSVPGERYSTRLLDLSPEGTVFYAAIPNLSETIAQSYDVLQERIAQNEALRDWWQKSAKNGEKNKDAQLKETIEKVRQFGKYLGDEIVVNVGMDANGSPSDPLVIGELKDRDGFQKFIETEIHRVDADVKEDAKKAPRLHIISDPLAPDANPDGADNKELYLWIYNDLFAFAPKFETLQRAATNLQTPQANRFKETSFHASIADVYRHGAGLILAADLQTILAHTQLPQSKAYDQLGLTTLKHFIFDLKQQDGKGSNRAVLSFTEPRRGMASWLAAPGPMGALEYVSPEANMVAAFVVKEPTALVDDLLGALQTIDPTLPQHLADFERDNNLNIRRDFAAPLGGEFAFAVDGPVLPSPSWKMILEVNEPARLQQTFERVVEKLNEAAKREGRNGFALNHTDESGGRTFYTLKSLDLGLEVSYTYLNGYFVMTPNRAMLERAVRYHDSGVTLLRSAKFTAALPEDGNANFSALFYHDLAPLIEPLARRMGGAVGEKNIGAEGQSVDKTEGHSVEVSKVLSSLSSMSPTLAYAYAQGDQIVLSANTDKGPFGLNPGSLLSGPGSFGLQHILEQASAAHGGAQP